MQLRMSDREQEAFKAFASRATSYFEYGIGGSTYAAAGLVKGRLVAIDSDPGWVEKARAAIPPSEYERQILCADIGATRKWGYPVDMTNPARFQAYYGAIAEHGPDEFELCLVDGRFRIACFLSALKCTRPETIIAIHDYRSRAHYHRAEEYGRVIYEAEDISFFVRRRDKLPTELDAAIAHYGRDAQ